VHKMMRSPVYLMALTICIDFVGFGLILPLLPFWSEHLGAGPVGVGLVLTMYALAQFLFTPLLGTLSDRFGRRPVIFASLLIEAFSLALCALAGSLPLLLVARFIGGLGASNIGSAQAVVADVTPIEGRARGMGLIGAAVGLGFVIGPALGSLLAPLGPAVPFWVAMLVALANALLVLRFLPETRWTGTSCPPVASAMHGRGLAGWRQVQRHPLVARLVVVNLLFTIAFTAMETVFALFTQHTFGWTTRQNGYLFTYIGLLVVFMQGGVVGQLARRWGEYRLLLAGLVLLAAGLALLPWSTKLASLVVVLGIVSIGDGAVTPMLSTLLSFVSAPDARGETLGLAQGVAGLARIIGPLAAGIAYAVGGAGAPFLFGSVLVAVAALIAFPARSSMLERDLAQSVPDVQTASFEETHAMAREQ
jgi:DHA1 family tetracycline resistance protein-like MFS transporter